MGRHIFMKSIMIVDDSDADQFILETMVEKIDGRIHMFKSWDGAEAIQFLQNFDQNKSQDPDKFPPGLIVLDINMPRMNGFEFLEAYQQLVTQKKCTPIPVVMYSTSDAKSDKEKALQYEVVEDYVVKPFDLESLEKTLKNKSMT